jgi:predicted DNA-binding transcriptional regulator YafY
MPTSKETAIRRSDIVRELAQQPCTYAMLAARLIPSVTTRCVQNDLAHMAKQFPGRIKFDLHGKEKYWSFHGDVPKILEHPITAIDDDQITALIAARGLLRVPQPVDEPVENNNHYRGALAQAINRLLHDMGLHDDVQQIAPDTISISRFGVAPEEDDSFPIALSAIRAGESLAFRYTNLDNKSHDVHAHPIRLVHITGEWHLFAWASDEKIQPGKVKQYRLSRMANIARSIKRPTGCPNTGLRSEVNNILRNAFRATGSTNPKERLLFTLAISPNAWPFFEKRRWGDKQKEIIHNPDLPADWRRLSFQSTGLRELRYWALSFGKEIIAESPPELRQWLRDQAAHLSSLYAEKPPVSATTTNTTSATLAAQTNHEPPGAPMGDRVRE